VHAAPLSANNTRRAPRWRTDRFSIFHHIPAPEPRPHLNRQALAAEDVDRRQGAEPAAIAELVVE
jgi:hypothetical protein